MRTPSWKHILCRFCTTLGIGTVAGGLAVAETNNLQKSEWVYPGPDGKLVYKTTATGDRIMDFSHAGYMGGGVALPTVPVKRTVQPSGGADDTGAIQAALNAVGSMPLDGQFRGAVLLAPGTYHCLGTITISNSGVVLRGAGNFAEGGPKSVLRLGGRPHTAIVVRASGGGRPAAASSRGGASEAFPTTAIADSYVPAGAISFTVVDASGFHIGDPIEIRRPVTPAWVKFLQMDDLVRDGKPQTWLRTGSVTVTERRVTAVTGNRITLDVPLSDSFDAKYLSPPGTIVAMISSPARISQAGIEDLGIESPAQAISHSEPHFTAVRMNGEDCWMRDVVIAETMNSVGVNGRRITLLRVAVNRKALHQGSSRPAEFAPNAGQVLLDRCTVNADNVWFAGTGSGQAGPIVLLNCVFQGDGRVESHQRWSTGLLYDNCRAPRGGLDFRNRGSMGSGHGWSMGWGVAWNCVAKDYVIQNPPGAVNWMIGCAGTNRPLPRPFGSSPTLPLGTMDSNGKAVAPQSLYLAQLAERLGPQALRAVGYQPR